MIASRAPTSPDLFRRIAKGRTGIATILVGAVLLLAALVLLAAGVAVVQFDRLRSDVDDIALTRFNQVAAMSEVVSRNQAIAAAAPRLALAEDRRDLDQQRLAANRLLGDLDAALVALEAAGGNAETVALLRRHRQVLAENLEALQSAVERRLAVDIQAGMLRSDLARAMESQRTLRQALYESFADSAVAEAPADQPAVRVIGQIEEISRLALSLLSLQQSATVQRAERQLHVLRNDVQAGLAEMGGDLAAPYAALFRQIDFLVFSPDGLLTLSRDQVGAADAVRWAMISNAMVIGQFGATATDLHRRFLDDFLAERDGLGLRIKLGSDTLIILTILAAIGAAMVVGYLRLRVTHRLTELRDSMLAQAAGEDAPIPTDGDDEIGEMGRAVQVLHDALERRAAEVEAARDTLRTVFNAVNDAIFVHDADGRILDVNQRVLDWHGIGYDEALALTIENDFSAPGADRERLGEIWRRAQAGEVQHFQWLSRRPSDGSSFVSDVVLAPIRILGEQRVIATVRDITQETEAKRAIERAAFEAEEASRIKSQFLANMSHEIRTPINAIIGLGHLMLQTALDDRQRDYVRKLQGSARFLLSLINDVLDLSKVEAGKLELEETEFRLREVLDNLAEMASVDARTRDIEVLFSVDPAVPDILIGDPLRLNQVLTNLVSNAIKFTETGEVVVAAQVAEAGEGSVAVRFSVRDTGIGLTEEQRQRLFALFSQADSSTTRRFGGTGLGLAISQRLVDLMGGEIDVESEPGKGSEFFFTVTFPVAADQRPGDDAALVAEMRGRRALVVDDNPTARAILRDTVAGLGLEVTTAASAEAALQALREAAAPGGQPFELVLMDWRMPGMDGLEAGRLIKTDPTLAVTPVVIMVTAYGHSEVGEEAKAAGLEAMLVKPVSPSMLRDALMRIGGHKGGTASDGTALTAAGLAGRRVLLVEDSPLNQEVASEILIGAGAVVQTADNGAQAVEILARDPAFDLVLMDVQMPVMDGYSATRHIREDLRLSDLPIVALTANALTGERERCLAAGMNDLVTKPIEIDDLFEALARWLPGVSAPPATETSTACPDASPAPAGIDVPGLLRRLGGSREVAQRLLGNFWTSQTDAKAKLVDRLTAGQAAEARRLAHTLAGTAGNLGLTEVRVRAKTVEGAIVGDSVDLAEPALAEALAALDTALAAAASAIDRLLADWRAQAAPEPAAASADPAEARRRLEALRGLLEASDMAAIDALVPVREALGGLAAHEMTQLAGAVQDLDFAAAMGILSKLIAALEAETDMAQPKAPE